jgi:hypothetical protein
MLCGLIDDQSLCLPETPHDHGRVTMESFISPYMTRTLLIAHEHRMDIDHDVSEWCPMKIQVSALTT